MSHTLELTDEELRTLALAVYLGERMANIGSSPGKETYPEIAALLNRIYKQVDEDAAEGKAEEIIAEYDEDTMFEELAHALAERDVHERIDHAAEPSAEKIDRRGLERRRARYYHREFDAHGLGRVVVNPSRQVPCEDE